MSARRCRRPIRSASPSRAKDPFARVDEIREAVLEALAEEAQHMLEEGVVASAKDIDTALILGAGFPLFMGGLTKYLDQTGVAERVVGRLVCRRRDPGLGPGQAITHPWRGAGERDAGAGSSGGRDGTQARSSGSRGSTRASATTSSSTGST